MRINTALSLRRGNLVLVGKEQMRVLIQPESYIWRGRPAARVTVADELQRTRIYTHDEIELYTDEAA